MIQSCIILLTLIISIQLGWARGLVDLAVGAFFVDDVDLDILTQQGECAFSGEEKSLEEMISEGEREGGGYSGWSRNLRVVAECGRTRLEVRLTSRAHYMHVRLRSACIRHWSA